MSYKKFIRHHGKTSRIKKYKWSNPDHRWVDSNTGHTLPCVNIQFIIEVGMYFGGHNGKCFCGYKKILRRKERRANSIHKHV